MRKVLGALALAGGAAVLGLRRVSARIEGNPDPFNESRLAKDPEGETAWVERPDGTRIRCVVAGRGPDVVLAHGYGVSLKEWNVVMDRLVDDGHRVIAFDWRGHGRTNIGRDGIAPEVVAGDFAALLEHFDARDAVLVGHSTGGYLSIATLLIHPETVDRLAGLVLFASLAGDAVVGSPQNRLQIPLITSGVLERAAASPLLGYPFAASVFGPDPSPAACRVFLSEFLDQDHQALVPLLERLAHTSFYDRLGEITVPTIVVCGEEDQTTPRWHSETMARDIPDARAVWVPGAGHMLNWQAPEVLIDAIVDLRRSAEPAAQR